MSIQGLRKTPTSRSVKILFARSGGVCSFPGCQIHLVDPENGALLGEMCHINAVSEGGPRFDAMQPDSEKKDSKNLVILCPTHHRLIDQLPDIYSADVIRKFKSEHEATVAELLTSSTAKIGKQHTIDLARQLQEQSIDFAIIVALPKELNAVLQHFPELKPVPAVKDSKRKYFSGTVNTASNGSYRIVVTLLPLIGNLEAAHATSDLISRWNPRFILMNGIAGGLLPSQQNFGDIVISEAVIYFEVGKVRDDDVEHRIRQFPCDRTLISSARSSFEAGWKKKLPDRPDGLQASSGVPEVHFGPVASGDKVISSGTARAVLLRSQPNLVAIEMESAGIASTAFSALKKIGFLSIRSICDFADSSKNDDWQQYAASAAAAYLRSFLQERPAAPSEGSWPILEHSLESFALSEKLVKRKKLLDHFCHALDHEEFLNFCFLIDVEIDNSSAESKAAQARKLIQQFEASGRIDFLESAILEIDFKSRNSDAKGEIRSANEFSGFLGDEIKSTKADVTEILRIVSEQAGVPIEPLKFILSEMGENVLSADADRIVELLKKKAQEFANLKERLSRLTNHNPQVAKLRELAAEALLIGKFRLVDQHLADAEELDLLSLDELEQIRVQKTLSAADTRASRGQNSLLGIHAQNYKDAAKHFHKASEILGELDSEKTRAYQLLEAKALTEYGDISGDPSPVEDAIDLLRRLLTSISKEENLNEWARVSDHLGVSLATLGERQTDTRLLRQAVVSHRDALEVFQAKQELDNWAACQVNIGAALAEIGRRNPKLDELKQAINAFEAAAHVRTKEMMPIQWASIQFNIGSAYLTIGERSTDSKWLRMAIAIFESILKYRPKNTAPKRWASTMVNLALANQNLGEHEQDETYLRKAVTAYRAALDEDSKTQNPVAWATTQNNLGSALKSLSDFDDGENLLIESLTSYQNALEIRTRERHPYEWASTQNNLGTVYFSMGEKRQAVDLFERAVEAFGSAKEVWLKETVPLDWSMCHGNQGVAYARIAEKKCDLDIATNALEQIDAAFTILVNGGHRPFANYYRSQLEIVNKLIRKLSSQ